ncbi:FtsB family cell division protein [Liquorilactobacillus uvarum]|uniref:FtsB family cell division protein n=1 Tax=Liquorilactobacillus uvarum TaxID=303240 RepID=UPI00288C5A4C|nr:septum formation initiator family protein [Liquorilactobacillus uvarum]
MAGEHKIKILNNDFFKLRKQQAKLQGRKLRVRRVRKRRIAAIVLVTVVITVILGYQIINTRLMANSLSSQTQTAKEKLNNVNKEQSDLKNKVKRLNEEDYLEKMIREKYYYSKKGETIYSFPNDKSNGSVDKK